MNYTPPGPGSWFLDAAHCERPHSRYVADWITDVYASGFRQGFARYGILLDTIELQLVGGFSYMSVRPLGAPPGATGVPPRPIFWLLTRLHPAIRRRIKVAREVFEEKRWRADVDAFFDEDWPNWRVRLRSYAAEVPAEMSDEQLIDHLERGSKLVREAMFEHFSRGPIAFVPVGDFAVKCMDWTGCDARTAIGALTGSSPRSLDALVPLDDLVKAITDEGFSVDGDPEVVVARLRGADGAVGTAARVWLSEIGERIFTGHDVAEHRGVERLDVLVESLRGRLAHRAAPADTSAGASLRDRVPAAHRERFDALLEEARYAHQIRDGRGAVDFWAFGLVRRALLEAGRRLANTGRLHDPTHVVDLTHAELSAALEGAAAPSADEVAAWVELRTTRTCADMPDLLGPVPGEPPPPHWLPAAGARVAAAMGFYLDAMHEAPASEVASANLSGIAASPGSVTATARVVKGPEDFSRIQPGDVLVARITSNAYNILLPLLGGIVTERGGLLSHPAIVAREYGIPGIVGARGALAHIPDGARIELDGHAGTVRVLA